MATSKRISDLTKKIPENSFEFIVAQGGSNFKVSFADMKSVIASSAKSSNDQGVSQLGSTLNGINSSIDQLRSDLSIDLDSLRDDLNETAEKVEIDTFVFITSVENHNGAVFYEYMDTPSPNTVLSKVYVESADNLDIKVRWDGPTDEYIGSAQVKINESYQSIPNSNISELGSFTRRFEGFLNGDFSGQSKIFAKSGKAEYSIDLIELGPGPAPNEIQFGTVTPRTGTDLGTDSLKSGDTVEVKAFFDVSLYQNFDLQKPNKIILLDKGLSNGATLDNLSLKDTADPNIKTIDFSFEVSGRNGQHELCMQAVNVAGIIGAETCSDTHSADSLAPTISFNSIQYPQNQQAIKDGETAIVDHQVNDADVFTYTGAGFDIIDPNSFSAQKEVIADSSVGYIDSGTNFSLSATKTSNGLTTTSSTLIQIANDSLQLNIQNLDSNIKSSPSGLIHSFTLKSDQKFLEVPSLSLDNSQNPSSNLVHSSQGLNLQSNTFKLTVSDGDQTGNFPWTVSAKNLAGIVTTTVSPSNYNIQGFSQRIVTATKDSLAQGLSDDLGVNVVNANNIYFENLSKGGSGENKGTVYTYKAFTAGTQMSFLINHENQFTVCDSNGTFNPNGRFLFNLDALNRDANSDKNNPAQFIVRED